MASPRSRLLVAACLPLWLLAVPPMALASGGANAPAAAEAFLDDPALDPGTGTPLDLGGDGGEAARIVSGSLDLTGAEPGAHTLYVRVQDQAGRWSAPIGQSLYLTAGTPGLPLPPGANNAVLAAEAFLDQDPGAGQGTALTAADGGFDSSLEQVLGALDLSGRAPGAHTLYVRTRDGAGLWSAPIGQGFYLAPGGGGAPPGGGYNQVAAAEAFVDGDPGQGRGIPLDTALDGSIDSAMEALGGSAALTGLVPGPHVLNVRFRDSSGWWSAPIRQSFFVAARVLVPGGGGAARLVAAQGQVDGGTPMSLPADDGAFDDVVETASLALDLGDGYHSATIRFQDSLGQWSDTVPSVGGCVGGIPLSGRLVDATTGAALVGVSVSAGGLTATTDASGQFSILGLPCGAQVVTVAVPGFEAYRRRFDPALGGWLEVRLIRPAVGNGLSGQSGFASDPVNTATGNYVYERRDLEIPGIGLPFRFERAYNSREASTPRAAGTPLGYGWTHSYRISLANVAGTATITWGDGHTETHAPDGVGGFVPQYGVFDTLTDNGDGTFSLRKRDGTRYAFDTAGRLAAIADKNGNTLALGYTGDRLTEVVDTAGRSIGFGYDGAGRLVQLTDPMGRTVQYAYDGNGDLVSAADPNGNLTQYGYDGRHQILTLIDPRGHTVVNNTYDADRRVVTYQTDAKGGATAYSYDETDRITTITDALGGVMVHWHDDLLRLVKERDARGAESLYVYDAAGNRVQVVDKNGYLTEYGYDGRGNVTSKRDALGQITTIAYDGHNDPLTRTDPLSQTTRYTYDANGNLLSTQDPAGGLEMRTYDARGLPLTRTDALGRTTTNAYDAAGNLMSVQDALGDSTQYGYDGVGRRLTRTDALGRTTAYGYDANDNLTSVTDPAGKTVQYAYDANDNRIAVTDRLGQTTAFAYDEKDLLETLTDALGQVATSGYDALDRKTAVTDRNGHLTQTAYDALGNPVAATDALGQTTASTFDAKGNRLRVTNPLGQVIAFEYDALDRQTTTVDALGHRMTTAYDALGRVVARTNANGQTTQMRYDRQGRLTQVTDAAGGTAQYAYDAVGNRLTMINPNGQVTTYAYDALNRLTSKVEALGSATAYEYDAVGNLARLTKPNGTILTYAYDAVDRLASVGYPDGSSVTFGYDAEGRRTRMVDRIGTSTFVYDPLGRLIGYTDPRGNVLAYAYDPNGNLTALTYPGGKVVAYAYDSANRLTGVTDWAGRATGYSYDSAGHLTGSANPNGTGAQYRHDAAGRLVGLDDTGPSGAAIAGYTLTLDAVGNRLEESRDEPLAPVTNAAANTYVYDAEDRLSADNGVTSAFDANGNRTAKGSDTDGYDADDRLVQSSVGGSRTAYGYDGLGNRLSRTLDGAETRYVVDPSGKLSKVLAETDAANNVKAYYVYGLGLISRIAADGSVRFYHHDPQGSTVALSDSAGAVTDQYAYDPFGAVTAASGTTTNPFRYVGRHGLMDDGNGLLYVRARYYDPATGRFIAKDPLPGSDTETQSLHRYVYALDNPVRFIDVTGLSAKEGDIARSNLNSSDKASDHGFESITVFFGAMTLCDANDSLDGYLACADSIAQDRGLGNIIFGATVLKGGADVVMADAGCAPVTKGISEAYSAADLAVDFGATYSDVMAGDTGEGWRFVAQHTAEDVILEGGSEQISESLNCGVGIGLSIGHAVNDVGEAWENR